MIGDNQYPGADIYVDLGTANTLVAVKNRGLLVNEPTVIAYSEKKKGQKKVEGVGKEAEDKLLKAPGVLRAYRPLKEGVIADSDVTETLLRYYFEKLHLTGFFKKPNIILSLPFGVTEVERLALLKAGKKAGASSVLLVDEPMLAAIGAGVKVEAAEGHMVVDIGGGTTEVAVIALADIVYCQAARFGGRHFDEAIQNYLKYKFRFLVSDSTAEHLKIELGTATPKKDIRKIEVQGRDADGGLVQNKVITSEDIGLAMDDGINQIMNLIHGALEQTPPELVSDLIETGIVLAGGGALIKNLDLRISNEIRLPVKVADNPLLTIAKGGEIVLQRGDLLDKILLES